MFYSKIYAEETWTGVLSCIKSSFHSLEPNDNIAVLTRIDPDNN